MLQREFHPPRWRDRARGAAKRAGAEVVQWAWDGVVELGAIGPRSRRGRRFGAFGAGSVICFPASAIFNEHYIHIGRDTMIGPHVSLSAGMAPGQTMISDPVVRIGDRCLIGKGSGSSASVDRHRRRRVTGPYVYITTSHGYEDVICPIARQTPNALS
jgi:acetyltransferase-like isoleucine patch superfamily enzyme